MVRSEGSAVHFEHDISTTGPVITPGYIKELDNKRRLLEDEYPYYGVTEEECDGMGEMCDPYEGL